MTPLKAVVEPMLMSARRAAMTAVTATALTGIEVLSLICRHVSSYQGGNIRVRWLTLLSQRQPGRPLSLAKAQQMREVEAAKPTFALMVSTMTMEAITAAPDRDWTA